VSVEVKEVKRSRTLNGGSQPTARLEYIVYGTEDAQTAELAVFANAPSSYASLVLDTVNITPHGSRDDVYTAEVSYRKARKLIEPEINSEEITFDLASQTVTRTHSVQTIARYPSSAPNFQNGVGWNGESFEGAEVYVEAFSFGITKYLPKAAVTNQFIRNLRLAAFHTNASLWRGFAVGEVLFVGCSGSPRSEDDYSLNYKFLAAENLTGQSVGGISGISVKAWEHLWALNAKTIVGDDEDTLIEVPGAAYVERYYGEADFEAMLLLGA